MSPAGLLDRRRISTSGGGPRSEESTRISAVRECGCALHFKKGGAAVPLKGSGWVRTRMPPDADNLALV